MADEARYEDVLGQFPLLKTYHHVAALFPRDYKTSLESVVQALEAGAAKLVAQIPWLGDQVINEGKAPGNSGVFKLAAWPSDAPANTLVRSKDCSDLLPSYTEIIEAGAPISKLDGSILCPVPGFPLSYDESKIGPAPVVILQANFIKGGLLLNFSFQHNIMDMSGLFAFMNFLATAMRHEEIPAPAIEQANRDRRKVVPLLGPGEPIRDHSHLRIPPASTPTPAPAPAVTSPPAAPASWAYFRISLADVAAIKALSSPTDVNAKVAFVSTNDALSAFYWKRLSTVRLRSGYEPASVSKFSRAIDARQAMGVPREYMGQLVYFAASFLTLRELGDWTLPAIAGKLRVDLKDVNNAFSVRSYATFLAGVQDKSTLAYGGPFNRELDIGSSSGSLAPLDLDFGPVLGKPDVLRRPNLAPLPGCLYFFPPEGSHMLMLVCLQPRDLEGLRSDPEWSRYTAFIG
ncbi:hypothetical protein F5884DRAFT_863428 [Xylogone sp. PMI_703]|nr:hypothetical protein F5884DRAFT_863428 [Xylogone sp. PMI_703]